MKRVLLATILIFLLCALVGPGWPGSTASVDPRLVTANNDFGLRLFAQLARLHEGHNVFLSPSSVAVALAMAYNGAVGKTREAMEKSLGLQGMNFDEVNRGNSSLLALLEHPEKNVQLANAQSLWVKQDVVLKPDYLQRVRESYHAEVANLDLADQRSATRINDFIRRKTDGKIDQVVKPGDFDPLTFAILVSAIYFKGMWQYQFDSNNTREGVFQLLNGRKKKVPLMSMTRTFRYFQNKELQAISLPYASGRLTMEVFLPAPSVSFASFCKQFNGVNYKKWIAQLRETKLRLVLPRFKLEYEAEFKKPLTTLGMGIAFGDADFSGMWSGGKVGLYIDKVRHKARVEVNEEGTEATAATTVIMKLRGAEPEMVVNRPFVFAIRDTRTDALLFVGAVVDPQ